MSHKKDVRNIELGKRDGQLFIRCPAKLKKMIAQSAVRSARSLAAEVSLRLLRSLDDYDFISNVDQD